MIRIYNAKILTMENGMQPFDGEIQTDGSRISYIGEKPPADSGDARPFKGEIDARGGLLMPGFKNAHTHSAMTFLRSHADDLPLLEWLNRQVFPWEAKLTPDDIYHLSKLAVMEYLTSGMTANFDMYLTPDTIAQASEDCGFRTVLCGALNDFSQSAQQLDEWYQKYNKEDSLISFRLGFHAEYTTSEEKLRAVKELSDQYHAPVYTHSSEGLPEVISCRERTGLTPTAYMDRLGLFENGGGCFHCVHMEPEDLRILKRRRVSVITNPASNLKLASGIAPIKQMLDMGISLAIGTDGPASNNCLDMFREMFLVTGLSKYRENYYSSTDSDTVLKMATLGGAAAMGLSDCDILAEGKQADLILIDLNQPNMRPVHNLTKNLVYSGSKQNVRLTMVAGKILYEDGEFSIGEEPDFVYRKAEEITGRIFGN